MDIDIPYRGRLLAGVDEVGRGPLAGDVVTAAVILDPALPVAGLADSKKLSPARRERIAGVIRKQALSWCLGRASVEEIDRYNILQATLMAMDRAVRGLKPQPEYVLVDGNRLPAWRYPGRAIIRGDDRVPAISAAAILAKVARDAEMVELDREFPEYGFADHKGYGTARHLKAIDEYGPCRAHRRSFKPLCQGQLSGQLRLP